MNIDTNELRRFSDEEELEQLKKDEFIELPTELQDEAEKELGICEAKIVTNNHKLLSWAEKMKLIRKGKKNYKPWER